LAVAAAESGIYRGLEGGSLVLYLRWRPPAPETSETTPTAATRAVCRGSREEIFFFVISVLFLAAAWMRR
jgi:hypothetical protein